ncbi:MBL fold metallo-hydrolase [Hyphomonas sp.]|jgi:glyoxylase-like metal-dependent hydrolase (beta-lactamase superfamily II)|uniref:MBL fold metallo-hydrolase n=1 Tax=Hyphomonas sp. TaxID=87 RepID=UPI000413614E|nr:MBL fold metallo-hydrolase [Hyphomonas sp.]MEE2920405.1 MBL fold metallo-hydrolase [Pseudomonadota bacterium]
MDGTELSKPKRPRLEYPLGQTVPAIGEMKEVAPGLHWVAMPLHFSLKSINVWLIDDGDGWTIVDTGIPYDETRDAWRSLLTDRISEAKPLKRVIVTHMHPDHVGTAGWLCHKWGAELWMTRLEYTTCRMLVSDTGRSAPKAGLDFYLKAGWNKAQIDQYKERFGGFGRGVMPLPDSFRRLVDGDTFEMAGQVWEVVTGSGHSPEHASLFCPSLNIVISGDQLLPRISSNVSVHPTEPAANPLLDWLESCEKLKARLPEDVLVLPAHNEPFTGAHKRLQHLIDGHHVALDRLLQRLGRGPMKAVDTFTTLFGRSIADDEVSMATGEALAHLNYLIYRGDVSVNRSETGVDLYSLN